MTLNYLGEFAAAPTSPAENDAYFDTTLSKYRYYSSSTWTDYTPIKIIDDLVLSTVYEGSGAPTAASNAVQLPTLTTGTFWLNGATGDVYAYISPSGWSAW